MSELVPEDALCPGVVFLSLRKMRPCDQEEAVSGENGSCPLSDLVGGTQDTNGDHWREGGVSRKAFGGDAGHHMSPASWTESIYATIPARRCNSHEEDAMSKPISCTQRELGSFYKALLEEVVWHMSVPCSMLDYFSGKGTI